MVKLREMVTKLNSTCTGVVFLFNIKARFPNFIWHKLCGLWTITSDKIDFIY